MGITFAITIMIYTCNDVRESFIYGAYVVGLYIRCYIDLFIFALIKFMWDYSINSYISNGAKNIIISKPLLLLNLSARACISD